MYTDTMRRGFETLRRSSVRATVLVPTIVAFTWWIGRSVVDAGGVTHYPAIPSYHVAFAVAALTLFLATSSVTPAWGWSSRRQLTQILAPVGVATLVFALVEVWRSTSHMTWLVTVATALGALHLGLLATLAVRLTTRPGASTALFVLAALVLPALLPSLRPLLDAAPSFHSASFPRSSAVLTPILTLAVIVLALPPCSITATLRGDLE